MPVSLPTSEMEIHSIAATQAANDPRLSRGIAVSCNPGNPRTNNTAAAGFFGVLVEDQLPNTLAATKTLQLPCCNRGLCEVLVSIAVASAGTPLTLAADNTFIPAAAGQKVYARSRQAGAANTLISALVHNEGTL